MPCVSGNSNMQKLRQGEEMIDNDKRLMKLLLTDIKHLYWMLQKYQDRWEKELVKVVETIIKIKEKGAGDE